MKSDPSPTLSLRAGRRSATVLLTAICALLLAAGSAAAISLKSRGAAHRSGVTLSTEATGSLTVTAPTSPTPAEAGAAEAGAACCTSLHTPAATRGASRRLKGRGRSHALAQPRGVTRAAEGAGARSSGGASLAQQTVAQGSATAGARTHKGLRLKSSSGRLASRSHGKREARSQAAPKVSGSTTAPAAPSVSPAPSISPSARAASTSSTPSPGSTATGSQATAKRARLARHRSRPAVTRPPARSGTGALATLATGGRAPAAVLATAPTSTKAPAAPGRLHTRGSAGPSPIERTITRIVSVVPTPVWILIGALLALALLLAVRSRFSAVRARRLESQRRQLLDDVGLLQAALLPIPPARVGPVGTSAAYRPADGFAAGGDFYDVFGLEDGQVGVIVGDVSGHGRDALPHTALMRYTLRAYLEAGLSPRTAIKTAGTVLERQLGGSFATVVAATYNPRERQLVYAGAGHPPPIVLGSGSHAFSPITVSSSPPIGAGRRTGARQTVVSVPGRGTVCFYTDGVTEARVGADLFGPERLRQTVAGLQVGDSASVLLDRVAEQTDARPDDMAACLLYLAGGAARPKVLLEELELSGEDALSDPVQRFLLECGLQADEIAEITRQASVAAGQKGTALLQVRFGDGRPAVNLHRENVARLHPRRAPREAIAGVAR